MLYPLSYGRGCHARITGRNVAKDYPLTGLRRKSAPACSDLQGWALGAQTLHL